MGLGRCRPVGWRRGSRHRWSAVARASPSRHERQRLPQQGEATASVVRGGHAEKIEGDRKGSASSGASDGPYHWPSDPPRRGTSEAGRHPWSAYPHEATAAMVACPPTVPLAVSIWGNDLTHQASASRLGGRATRRVLARTDLLFADCQRDIDLAGTWGLRLTTPTAVLPGGGGIDLARVASEHRKLASQLDDLIGPDHRVVVNARGARPYVRNEVLLEALSLLEAELDHRVRVVFIDSAHDGALCHAIERHRLTNQIIVMGKCSRDEVLSALHRAEVSVSITDQDGTPNSLLEAMAAGAIPVCSDLPSIREWIEPGKNGFLAAFSDPLAVADALRLALGLSDAERSAIKSENGRIIAARAERGSTGRQAVQLYGQLV